MLIFLIWLLQDCIPLKMTSHGSKLKDFSKILMSDQVRRIIREFELLVRPFVNLHRNDLHISFTSSSVLDSIRLYSTLLLVSIQSSRNLIFLTFLFLVSHNNSFNLGVRSPRDVVQSGTLREVKLR